MDEQASWRPRAGGDIALTDAHLARIGYAVVTEAQAKSMAASVLKVLEGLSPEDWIKLERAKLKTICERLLAADCRGDDELRARLIEFDASRERAHELRHMIVHAPWGEVVGDDREPATYDYGRNRRLSLADVDAAVHGCAEMKRAAHAAAMRVGELIVDGIFPERPAGTAGMGIHTRNRPVRL